MKFRHCKLPEDRVEHVGYLTSQVISAPAVQDDRMTVSQGVCTVNIWCYLIVAQGQGRLAGFSLKLLRSSTCKTSSGLCVLSVVLVNLKAAWNCHVLRVKVKG